MTRSRATIAPANRSLSSIEGRARQLESLLYAHDDLMFAEWIAVMSSVCNCEPWRERRAFIANMQELVRGGEVEMDVRGGVVVYRATKGAAC